MTKTVTVVNYIIYKYKKNNKILHPTRLLCCFPYYFVFLNKFDSSLLPLSIIRLDATFCGKAICQNRNVHAVYSQLYSRSLFHTLVSNSSPIDPFNQLLTVYKNGCALTIRVC